MSIADINQVEDDLISSILTLLLPYLHRLANMQMWGIIGPLFTSVRLSFRTFVLHKLEISNVVLVQ